MIKDELIIELSKALKGEKNCLGLKELTIKEVKIAKLIIYSLERFHDEPINVKSKLIDYREIPIIGEYKFEKERRGLFNSFEFNDFNEIFKKNELTDKSFKKFLNNKFIANHLFLTYVEELKKRFKEKIKKDLVHFDEFLLENLDIHLHTIKSFYVPYIKVIFNLLKLRIAAGIYKHTKKKLYIVFDEYSLFKKHHLLGEIRLNLIHEYSHIIMHKGLTKGHLKVGAKAFGLLGSLIALNSYIPGISFVAMFYGFKEKKKFEALIEGLAEFLTRLFNNKYQIMNDEKYAPKGWVYTKYGNEMFDDYLKFIKKTGQENKPLRRFVYYKIKDKKFKEKIRNEEQTAFKEKIRNEEQTVGAFLNRLEEELRE